jgi:hypothetical protein
MTPTPGPRRNAPKPIPPDLITPASIAALLARCEVVGECWVWRGAVNNRGYAQVRRQAELYLVSRLVYTACHGPLGPGQCACHHCDNPPCIRPTHLFAGTARDNAHDMRRKGRFVPTPRRLSTAQARAIRARGGSTTREALAAEYGVSRRTIYNVIHHPRYAEEPRYVH